MTNLEGSQSNKGLFLHVLLNRTHGAVSEPLLKPLPPDLAQNVLRFHVANADPRILIKQNAALLPKMHYSWIQSALASLDPAKRKSVVASLEDTQRIGVSRLLKMDLPEKASSPILRRFYLKQLFPLLQIYNHLPLEYLPESPFNLLLNLKKNQIIKIINFMGLYDLVAALRNTVATKNIKHLYHVLTPLQQHFLKICWHHKDKVQTSILSLANWDGKLDSLMPLIHQRGLLRLSAALSGQHPDLIWHLTRILDIGRGQFIEKHVKPESIPVVTEALTIQFENVNHFLTENSE